MDDPRFERAVDTLRRLEDATATADRTAFGAVYRCADAPTLATLNFVRVDSIVGDLPGTATAARAAAQEHGLKTIVVDVNAGPMTNPAFETDDGEWTRVVRWIYAWEGEPAAPKHDVQPISLDDFIGARRAFIDASPDYAAAESDEEEAAARVFARATDAQYWGATVEGELVSVGELYFIDDVAQLESLSTLPAWEGHGFATAVTQARVNEARRRGASLVFAQIQVRNDASVAVHERVGFVRAGPRQTFVLE